MREFLVYIVCPRTGQSTDLIQEAPGERELLEYLATSGKYNTKVILITENNPMAGLQAIVLESNIDFLAGKPLGYAHGEIEAAREQIIKQLASDYGLGINEQEMAVFKALKDDYDNLVLAKTSINDIPTMAICQKTKTEDGETLKPLVIVVNDDLFKMLVPPDEI